MPIEQPPGWIAKSTGVNPHSSPNPSPSKAPSEAESPTAKLQAFLRTGKSCTSDDLDDYSGDFRSFVPLDGVETADMRYQRERLSEVGASETEATEPSPADPDADRKAAQMPDTPDAHKRVHNDAPSVAIDAGRCVHRYAGREGCRRCIDCCSFGAVQSRADIPQIDLEVCLECAACATVCPSGALQWIPSRTDQLLQHMKSALAPVTEQGLAPIVVFYDRKIDFAAVAPALGRAVVGLEVETVGIIGMEVLLSAMALGAAGVFVIVDKGIENRVRCLTEEMQWSQALLQALGFSDKSIAILNLAQVHSRFADVPDGLAIPPATYTFDHPKRALVRLAGEHLARHSLNPGANAALPDGAPFGAVRIDGSKCTLCMACAGACKLKALLPIEGDAPGLQFREIDCVQCGLCAQVCPEQAVSLVPRLNLNPATAASMATLHRAKLARCISCGRAFASLQMIASIQSKLQGHWMYDGAKAQRRLHMCDRCRVQDLFSSAQQERSAHHAGTSDRSRIG